MWCSRVAGKEDQYQPAISLCCSTGTWTHGSQVYLCCHSERAESRTIWEHHKYYHSLLFHFFIIQEIIWKGPVLFLFKNPDFHPKGAELMQPQPVKCFLINLSQYLKYRSDYNSIVSFHGYKLSFHKNTIIYFLYFWFFMYAFVCHIVLANPLQVLNQVSADTPPPPNSSSIKVRLKTFLFDKSYL